MKLHLLIFVLLSTVLTACGRAPEIDRNRAVGVDTALGQSLTKNKWCTPASTDGVTRPKFTTLDLRQTGKFFRSQYTLNDDRSLSLETKDRGTWALIMDKLYTQIDGQPAEVESKVALVEDTSAASAKSSALAKSSPPEHCVRLTVFARDAETFCPCDFVNN